VRLVCGIKVDDVLISGDRLTRVTGRDHSTFDAPELIEVEDQSERPLPPCRAQVFAMGSLGDGPSRDRPRPTSG